MKLLTNFFKEHFIATNHATYTWYGVAYHIFVYMWSRFQSDTPRQRCFMTEVVLFIEN